ncbi:hypothetical protein [Maridesulfovibrio ferrireducens]|uniref:hypothetical protein n=1 Tax=Maridesulfovibrio ferrireducens TaxID=246191 RepID=UPI001A25E70B|nr:hypothetical protein [Maridesulfovibrio ferrireducens]MBI9112776.1 hypothetical protein [Maridesulfovibrio ferrireducens]
MIQNNNQIIALTDDHTLYNDSEQISGLNIEHYSCVNSFFSAMLKNNYSGIILNMHKVMKTPCSERNKILSLSADLPTMRSIERGKSPIFIDDSDLFKCSCQKHSCLLSRPSCPITVSIPVKIGSDNDPAMAKPVAGIIHDICERGCTFHTDEDLTNYDFLYLKIESLANRLPIYSGVCKSISGGSCLCGYNVRFLDIKEDQLLELQDIYTNTNPTIERS